MPINDTLLRKAQPSQKNYRLQIGENTYLDVLTTGLKVWRMRYTKPSTNKPSIYTLGTYCYPNGIRTDECLTLRDVRLRLHTVKDLIKKGIDPKEKDAQQKAKQQLENKAVSLEEVTRDWHQHRSEVLKKWKPSHATDILQSLEKNLSENWTHAYQRS